MSEQELNELVRQHQPPEAPVKNLSVRVTPEGVRVSGEVTMMITMAFESLWRPERGGRQGGGPPGGPDGGRLPGDAAAAAWCWTPSRTP